MIDFTIIDIKNSIESLNELRGEIERQSKTVTSNYNALKSGLEKRISETDRAIGVASEDVNHAMAMIAENKTALARKEQKLCDAEAEKRRLTEENEKLRRREAEAQRARNSLKMPSSSDYPEKLQDLYHSALAQYNQQVEYYRNIIDSCNRTAEANQEKIRASELLIEKLKADIININENISKLNEIIETIKGWINSLKDYKSRLSQCKEQINSDFDAYKFYTSQAGQRISFCYDKESLALQYATNVKDGLAELIPGSDFYEHTQIQFSDKNVLADLSHNFQMMEFEMNDSFSDLEASMARLSRSVTDNITGKTKSVVMKMNDEIKETTVFLEGKARLLNLVYNNLNYYSECKA